MGRGRVPFMIVVVFVIMLMIVVVPPAMQGRSVGMAVLVFMAVAGQAVIVFAIRVGRAKIAPAADERQPHASGGAVGVGIGHAAVGPVGHAIIVGAAPCPFHMHGDVAFAHRQSHCAGTLPCRGGAL